MTTSIETPYGVPDYVEDKWKTWLQTHRVELNAMTTPECRWTDPVERVAAGILGM